MGVKEYLKELSRGYILPKDPYSHSFLLIESGEDEDIRTFAKIIDRQILLANISDDRMLKLYQNDAVILVELFDMARRDESIAPVFLMLYYQWKSELALTRVKDGTERKLQASVSGYKPDQALGGFGEEFKKFFEQENEEKALFDKLFKKK